ncbi:TetR/AcrR family transcriptional regulator [Runella aurantiaca]|uniref:TetR/AcrR family transcriptional regulator n=1 Tax=Runella aurantiaca TaxID=2282308 RepID=A0A369IK46_9BACT|nr:TetR/AcrR family transcriptional regulator [Runella aurantiaca]RDB06996.1 TetR/AcrR family transcriptional regulator [Runella aurantiaca]
MTCITQSSEEKIKEAAKTVFLKKGYAGTTARDIAEAASMNIALTNYYFRSKEKLFFEIFRDLFSYYCKNTLKIFEKPISIREKLIELIEEDFQMMKKEPSLVLFLMTEIHRDPERLLPELSRFKELLHVTLSNQIEEEIINGRMRNISVEHLMPLIMGSLQFVFVGKNMNMKMYNASEDEFNTFAENHKNLIISMITEYLFISETVS